MLRSSQERRSTETEAPIIVIDTREQRPYEFTSSVVGTLKTGDYSVQGLEDQVAVERKSHSDAYGSVGHGRDRFQREVERLGQMAFGAIVIECSLKGFINPPRYSRMNPRAAVATLLAWSVRYGVPVYFAEDRRHGQAVTRCLLEKFWRYHTQGHGHD